MPAIAQAKPSVVVVGGGPGGATAREICRTRFQWRDRCDAGRAAKQFVTCFHSNLYLGGFRDFKSITQSYADLAKNTASSWSHEPARAAIDRDKKSGAARERRHAAHYDRLVVAPGIDIKFDSVPGYSEAASESMPHAWKPGPQTQLLKKQLDALKDGALIVMVAPPNPYRCPPGPYERVSMMAHVLKAKGSQEFEDRRCSIRSRISRNRLCSSKAGKNTIPA